MTLTIDLPERLAEQLTALLTEDERRQFSVAAIADALAFRQDEAGDCQSVVEQAITDMDAGVGLLSFEEACRQWDAERAARAAANRP